MGTKRYETESLPFTDWDPVGDHLPLRPKLKSYDTKIGDGL